MKNIAMASWKPGNVARSRSTAWVLEETPDAVITFTAIGTPEWFYRNCDGVQQHNAIGVYPLREGWNAHFRHDAAFALQYVYINIASPARYVSGQELTYIDLHLDIWIGPSGVPEVLDEDEFAEAIAEGQYTPAEATAARATLDALLADIAANTGLYGWATAQLPLWIAMAQTLSQS